MEFNFLGWLLKIFFYGWWIPVLILSYLTWQKRRNREWLKEQKFTLLQIKVPKDNEKGPVAAEMMFASLHGIFKPAPKRIKEGSLQEHISFEIASMNQKISFYAWVPSQLKDFVEGQIYAQYPNAEIKEVPDYADSSKINDFNKVITAELTLIKIDYLPIRTFPNFEVDPLAGITSTLSKLEGENEKIWTQILVRPCDELWQNNAAHYVNAIRTGTASKITLSPTKLFEIFINWLGSLIYALFSPPQAGPPKGAGEPPKLTPTQENEVRAIEEKIQKLGFEVKIRILYAAATSEIAEPRLQAIVGAFKQFTAYNGFAIGNILTGEEAFQIYKSRYFGDPGYVLNIEELASIYHLPNISVETPNILWAGAKKGEPPANLPLEENVPQEELTLFAKTNFRHLSKRFGIKNDDRRRHVYIIGKTGVGKTTLMENMILDDISEGRGVAVVDPHGDFIDKILNFIPKFRINDVVILDPSDRDYPIAFNPLEDVNPDQRGLVVSGIISIFQKIWAYTWGPRLEHILRNTLAALIEYPNSTMLGINRMFTDKKFRKKVVRKVTDVETKRFWTQEFPMYEQNERFKTEAIAPIQNKVGQFLASPTIRNIIGQPKSNINMRKIMDEGKILLVKLAQGAIGEDNSALLGAMIITKLQLAAMSRVDIPEEERKDFYLYVDEFQNFATESFAKILSEARKYRLNLTLANQYVAQMMPAVRDAVFGNVGTLICFRVGTQDASFLAKEMAPVFDETDVVNLDKYNIYIKMSIDGVTYPAFSAQTLPPPQNPEGYKEKIITLSREKYSKPREFVEKKIAEWMRIEFEENGETREDQTPKTNLESVPKTSSIEKVIEETIPFEKVLDEVTQELLTSPKGQNQITSKQISSPPIKPPETEISKLPKPSQPQKTTSKKGIYELKPGQVVEIQKPKNNF